MSSRP
jgi:hypothetical protein